MSLPFIAMTGIAVGFLFLIVGFFMEDGRGRLPDTPPMSVKDRRTRRVQKRTLSTRRKTT